MAVLRPKDRRASEAAAKLFLAKLRQFQQIKMAIFLAQPQTRLPAQRGFAVPRTHFLAHIAAEQPIADSRAQLLGDGAAPFDGQVADAAPCIEPSGTIEGL